MEVTVGAEEWRRTSLTVVGQQACSRWLHNTVAYGGCGRHNGMEEEKNRVGAGDWVHITIIVFRISLRVYSSFTIK